MAHIHGKIGKEKPRKIPIRYFLSEELPFWWRVNVVNPINKITYWLKSHLFPSRRYHILDLRQPKKIRTILTYIVMVGLILISKFFMLVLIF
jgi:hypothetical protein